MLVACLDTGIRASTEPDQGMAIFFERMPIGSRRGAACARAWGSIRRSRATFSQRKPIGTAAAPAVAVARSQALQRQRRRVG